MSNHIHLTETDRRAVRNRLSRARGQLDAIIKKIEEDAACLDVLPQMIAASRAVDRATYAMVLAAIETCSTQPGDHPDAEDLKKIFLSLA